MSIDIDIIIPSFRSKELASLCIRSFEKYKGDLDLRYIVVENSDDESYKKDIMSLADNMKWIQNPTNLINSEANACAIEEALPFVRTENVFICHNDVAACRENWLRFLVDKMKKDDLAAAGYVLDNARINALHISGILVKTEIAKAVSMYPVYEGERQILDVGDSITQYCREKGLEYFSCRNTHNDESHVELCEDPYKELDYVDRAFDDDGNIIFLHLGRGTPKTLGSYWKSGRVTSDGWSNFVETKILS